MGEPSYVESVEISPGVHWVGYNRNTLLHTNAYLIVEGDEACLIDPGSMLDFDRVLVKVKGVCPIEKVKYIISHHQDPDLCGSTVEFEKLTDLSVGL